MAVAAAGCSSTSLQLPRWLSPKATADSTSEAPAAQPVPAAIPPADSGSAATYPYNSAVETSPRSLEKGTVSSPAPPKQVVVTLGESRDPGLDAEGAVNAAAARLLKLDRARLTPENAAVYDQASSFVGAARKSVADKDYPAAQGFARKASTLLTKLESDAPKR